MDIDRRSLMKGLLAGGALLAFGKPSWTFAHQPARQAKRRLLLLGNSAVDDAFADGVRLVCQEVGYEGLETIKMNGGLLSDPDRLVRLFDQTKGTRWIAVMDDGNAAVFQELARTAGGRLLSVGSHASVKDDGCPLRHTWLTASSAQGAAGVLASRLNGGRESFSITEQFVDGSSAASAQASWAAPGFSTYRSSGSTTIHLHCSGLSLPAGCEQIGLTGVARWTPLPCYDGLRETVSWPSSAWGKSTGYAVAASSLGVHSIEESCSTRAFVYRASNANPSLPVQRFVSFVMDM